jgi:hypothetical protein
VEVGHQHPQQTQQPEGQKRVVDPEPAVRVRYHHANIRSHEHLFACKNYGRHRRVTMRGALLAVGLLWMTATAGCLANPQLAQTRDLLDQLTRARISLGAEPAQAEACAAVGDVETRLYGEPGLVDVQPAWSQLAEAAHALQAVCGQGTLVTQQAVDSPAVGAARERWQLGIQRELGVACDHLRAAASALDRRAPC